MGESQVKRNTGLHSKLSAYGWIVCSLAALFYCYEYLLRIEPSVMVPQLMHYFNITAKGIGVFAAVYYYAYTPLQAVVGVLTDYFGPKKMLTFAMTSCVTGVAIFGLADNVYIAALGRFFVGIGSAFAFVGALKMAAIWLPKRNFALFVGLTMTLSMVGAMFGDIEMSWAVQHYGWRRVVIFTVALGAVLIPIFVLFVRSKKDPRSKKINRLLNFREGFAQLFQIIKEPTILFAGISGSLLYLSLSVLGEMWGIPFIHRMLGGSTVNAAIINSAVFLGWLVGSPLNGWLSDKIQSRRLPLIFGSIIGAIIFSFILIFPIHNDYLLFGLIFLFGLCTSVEVICFSIARDIYPIKYTATAVATINLLIMAGGMIMQPFVGWFLNAMWGGQMANGIRYYVLNDYRKAMVVIPVALLIAGFLGYMNNETYSSKRV